MGTTQPIRKKTDVKKFTSYYATAKPNPRNYCLIVLGLHTALRISDILELKWQDIYRFEKNKYVEHLFLHEKKTGKTSVIALSHHVIEALEAYRTQKIPSPRNTFSAGLRTAHAPFADRRHTALSGRRRAKR